MIERLPDHKLLSFVAGKLGHEVCAPGGLCGECVDLANLYLIQVLDQQPVQANATDWQRVEISAMHWVANRPENFPAPGSLAVWNPYPPLGIGRFGHIALVLGADVMHLLTTDQNWGLRIVTLNLHTYAGVAGWLSITKPPP